MVTGKKAFLKTDRDSEILFIDGAESPLERQKNKAFINHLIVTHLVMCDVVMMGN